MSMGIRAAIENVQGSETFPVTHPYTGEEIGRARS
jgi:hypothetical protein